MGKDPYAVGASCVEADACARRVVCEKEYASDVSPKGECAGDVLQTNVGVAARETGEDVMSAVTAGGWAVM